MSKPSSAAFRGYMTVNSVGCTNQNIRQTPQNTEATSNSNTAYTRESLELLTTARRTRTIAL